MGWKPSGPSRAPDPTPVPLCPWCFQFIEVGLQDTAKVNGITWHAWCAEDHELAEAQEGPQ